MGRPNFLKFRWEDGVAIAAVVLLAAAVILICLPRGAGDSAVAEIYRDGQLLRTVPLSQPQEFVIGGRYSNTVTVRDGKIAVTASDCPGCDCMRCGWIGASGRSIVCLPNGLEIRVTNRDGDVDFVVG